MSCHTGEVASSESKLRHIPNTITSLRIVIALFFPFAPESWHLTLVFIGLATEFLDGFLARTFHWTSYTGQILDPIADKVFVFSVSVTWIMMEKLSLLEWFLLATRDFGVLLIFLLVLVQGKLRETRSPRARIPSKITTALQYGVFLLVLANQLQWMMPLAIVTAVCGIIATCQYAWLVWHPDSPEKNLRRVN